MLNRYTREDDLVFGLTVSGRPTTLAGAESMVGLMINTLPVRVQISPKTSILEWLKQLAADEFTLTQYDFCPIVKIQEWSQVPRGLPLFESLVIVENYPARLEMDNPGGLKFTEVKNAGMINYPLALVAGARDGVVLKIVLDPRRIQPDAAARALRHLEVIIQGMLAHPDLPASALTILTPEEERQILIDWNNNEAPYPEPFTAHQLFENQAAQTRTARL